MLDIPADLASVQAVLSEALSRVEDRFNHALRSDLPVVERLCKHVERYRGKMLRPMLVVLSGMASAPGADQTAAEATPDSAITLAAVCEMIHMATLVHDDVLDEADTRRRGDTVNRLAGNETAVILGDYLFSAAYRLCSTIEGPTGQQAALLIGRTGMTLCAGELLQLHHRGDFSIDEPTYFEIVQRKTASLIAAACELGSRQSRLAEPGHPRRFHDFGLTLGVAFQIQDDLLDLTGAASLVGKPVRKDLEMGKLTLPLIHHLATASPLRRGRTLDALLAQDRAPMAPAALLAALEETGSVQHARAAAERLVADGKACLDDVAESPAKRLLLLMADAVITRTF